MPLSSIGLARGPFAEPEPAGTDRLVVGVHEAGEHEEQRAAIEIERLFRRVRALVAREIPRRESMNLARGVRPGRRLGDRLGKDGAESLAVVAGLGLELGRPRVPGSLQQPDRGRQTLVVPAVVPGGLHLGGFVGRASRRQDALDAAVAGHPPRVADPLARLDDRRRVLFDEPGVSGEDRVLRHCPEQCPVVRKPIGLLILAGRAEVAGLRLERLAGRNHVALTLLEDRQVSLDLGVVAHRIQQQGVASSSWASTRRWYTPNCPSGCNTRRWRGSSRRSLPPSSDRPEWSR